MEKTLRQIAPRRLVANCLFRIIGQDSGCIQQFNDSVVGICTLFGFGVNICQEEHQFFQHLFCFRLRCLCTLCREVEIIVDCMFRIVGQSKCRICQCYFAVQINIAFPSNVYRNGDLCQQFILIEHWKDGTMLFIGFYRVWRNLWKGDLIGNIHFCSIFLNEGNGFKQITWCKCRGIFCKVEISFL